MSRPRCHVHDLGMIEYGKAFDLQKQTVRDMLEGKRENTLYLLEHPPVYTIGRAGGEHNVLIGPEQRERLGITLFDVDRGGDVTYHGPGQLVGYPILNLEPWKNDVRQYVRSGVSPALRIWHHHRAQGRDERRLGGRREDLRDRGEGQPRQ